MKEALSQDKRQEMIASLCFVVGLISALLFTIVPFGVLVQNKFGPGIGQPWHPSVQEWSVLLPILIALVIFSALIGAAIGAILSLTVLPKTVVRKQMLAGPTIPLMSWYCEKLANLLCPADKDDFNKKKPS